MIVLHISLVALLIAAAGMTLHVLIWRSRSRSKMAKGADTTVDEIEESDQETEL
jgi:hypothetical protein